MFEVARSRVSVHDTCMSLVQVVLSKLLNRALLQTSEIHMYVFIKKITFLGAIL